MDITTNKPGNSVESGNHESQMTNLPDFTPRMFCHSGHIQTIASSLLGSESIGIVQERTFATPDNDFLEWDWFDAGSKSPIVVLLHGLEGSSKRYYIVKSTEVLTRNGFSTAALNFRSCGPHMNKTPRFYHSGETGDVALFVSHLRELYPDRPMFAVGYSLGANMLLKWLGETGSTCPLQLAIAVSAPYDLHLCSDSLGKGFNNIYQQYFLRSLKRKIRLKRHSIPSIPSYNGYSLAEFDDQVTAPLHGFKGVDDYYSRASCGQFISGIQVPTLIVHSRKDPICPIDAVPVKKMSTNKNLQTIITNEGGHIGYFGYPSDYLSRLIVSFFKKQYQN